MIECKDLCISYGSKEIIKDFNYKFEDNTIYAIVGTSGKGKTTLIKAIAGLLKPSSGSVIFNQKIITKPSKEIYMMHQSYTNFPFLTCLENIELAMKFSCCLYGKDKEKNTEIAKKYLESVSLNGYEDEYSGALSGGMNQRLALARLLSAQPDVLLMDEPMSALDDFTRRKMQDLILSYHKENKGIIIMITHDTSEAKRMADKIIEL